MEKRIRYSNECEADKDSIRDIVINVLNETIVARKDCLIKFYDFKPKSDTHRARRITITLPELIE